MSPKKNPPVKEKNILWGRSHDLCVSCKCDVIAEKMDCIPYPVGVNAYIEGENPNSARYNSDLDYPGKNSHENLILLCPTCHTKIDNDPETYSVEKLKQIKKNMKPGVIRRLGIRCQILLMPNWK